MCTHDYVANYSGKPASLGKGCPWPELYVDLHAGEGAGAALPLDRNGKCLFHSGDLPWKRENDFGGRFRHLLGLLNDRDDLKHYDFAEFVFVGEEDGADGEPVFRLADRSISRPAYFVGASFRDPVELKGLDCTGGVCFNQATFENHLEVAGSVFRGLDFSKASGRGRVRFGDVEFVNYALFYDGRYDRVEDGRVVRFEGCRFGRINDFSRMRFDHGGRGTVCFVDCSFEDILDFTGTTFTCHVTFDRVVFNSVVEFVDTSFETVVSAARYRGAALELNQIEVPAGAELTFRSTDALAKMFDHDVQISFAAEPQGVIRFENVNFHQLTPGTRERLEPLVRQGRVEIGPGCIKYRLQTEVRTIPVQPGNATLVLEICQTFANYFTAGNGLNLGFEVVERGREQVRFFYFSDENITEEEFRERLRHTEQDLWNLLSIQSTGQLLALQTAGEGEGEGKDSPVRERAILNTIDGMTALIGTFFRVGARIAMGSWQERDTRALLGAIRFDEGEAEQRVRRLHDVLVEKYTGRTLVDLNARQNQPLLPAAETPDRQALPPTVEKTRILFLGANFGVYPLRLDEEIRAIQDDLKRSRERDRLELKQEWAVTVDTLMRAMIDEAPHIVHFSGHAEASGILLLDDDGRPKRVEEEALARLFEACRDSVRCVVLNACYSEGQARAIRRHVPHVIGMRSSVPDKASIAFSSGFYRALGGGWDIPRAFEMGKIAIALEGIGGDEIPVLV